MRNPEVFKYFLCPLQNKEKLNTALCARNQPIEEDRLSESIRILPEQQT